MEANVVKYYQNGVLRYISTVAPTLPLVADVSVNTLGGTVTNALIVNNSNAGSFSVTATNAGPSPTFTWRVNGLIVQTGPSSSYTNTSLMPGDVVLCQLTPSLGGCLSTVYTSNIITINGPGVSRSWIGASNTNWYEAANWSGGVIPDRFASVTIPAGTPNAPTLTSDANVYDITINSGATFAISGNNRLFVYRNFTNNGTFTANTSTVSFVGCSTSGALSSSGTQTFHNVVVNSPFGLTISSGTHQIANNFTFTNGIVVQNANLHFLNASTATSASNSSFVDGPVRKIGNQAFTFPVGDNSLYRPLSISAPSNAAHFFTARYFNQDHLVNGGNAFYAVSRCEYWTLDRNTGPSSNVSVTLSWNAAACPPVYITNPVDLRVVRWSGADWISEGNGGTTGTPSSGTIVTATPVTSFISGNQFTFASVSAANPLPIVLAWLRAIPAQDGTVNLQWLTSSELNNDYFEVQHAGVGESFKTFTNVKGQGTTSRETRYEVNHRPPWPGIHYYRLKQVDFDGKFEYSQVVAATVKSEIQPLQVEVFPNPTTSANVNVRIRTADSSALRVRMFDLLGRTVYSVMVRDYDNAAFTLALPSALPEGTYLIQVEQGTGRAVTRVMIGR